MKVYDSIIDTIGNTPIVKVTKYTQSFNLKANLFLKLESFNPGGSVKDRISKAMLETAIKDGKVNQDTTIIEPTSGNTGIGLAQVCAALGYQLVITMPDTMSIERQLILKAYGAKVVLTDGALGMKGAIAEAELINQNTPNSLILAQFDNPANPLIHYQTTGPEIWRDLDHKVDVLISGVGTGGTITGAGKFLKTHNPQIKIIAVEPTDSPVLSGGVAGKHGIQGIGAGFVPAILDTTIYDQIIQITTEEAFVAARALAKTEGILVGISAGAALAAATKLTQNEKYTNKNIVIIMPDTGERYLSTDLFKE